MAIRGERERLEVSYQFNASGVGFNENHDSPLLEFHPADPEYYEDLQAAKNELQEKDLIQQIDPTRLEVISIFAENQAKAAKISPYHLIDDGFSPKNPFCHPEAVEDDYSENSMP